MPEFGVMFKFNADYDHVAWYGMGPSETYVDRIRGAKLGVYKNLVADNMAKYLGSAGVRKQGRRALGYRH